MFQLAVAIIFMVLIAALAIASIHYGGDAWNGRHRPPGKITIDANPATGNWVCTVPKGAELKDCRQFTRTGP